MPQGTWTVTIRNRSPEEVFAYLVDIDRHAEWSPKPYTVEHLTEGPMRVGSRYHSVGWLPPRDNHHENDVEITAVDPPRRFAFTALDQGQPFTSEFTLAAQDGGTRVERRMNLPKPGGFAGAIFPVIFAAVVKPGIQKGMNLLKARMEQAPAGPA